MNKIWCVARVRALAAAAFAAALAGLCESAGAGVESAMREYQARYSFLRSTSLTTCEITWPSPSGGGTPGPYPADGIYLTDADKLLAVQALYSEFFDGCGVGVCCPHSIMSAFVREVEGLPAPAMYSLDDFPGLKAFSQSGNPIDLQNYQYVLGELEGAILQFREILGSGTVEELEGRGSAFSWTPEVCEQPDWTGICEQDVGPAIDLSDCLWQSAEWDPVFAIGYICQFSNVGNGVGGPPRQVANRYSNRGKICVEVPSGFDMTAAAYLSCEADYGGPVGNPPVSCDGLLHGYFSASASTCSSYIADSEPEVIAECGGESRGWWMSGLTVVLSPEWDTAPGSHSPVLRRREKDCKEKSKSSNPVDLAWGDKLEREVDLSMSLPGTQFRVERGYTSDPAAFTPGDGDAGAQWTLSIQKFLEVDNPTTPTQITVIDPASSERYEFTSIGSGVFGMGGGTTERITQGIAIIGGRSYNVWIREEPGKWTAAYAKEDGPAAEPTSAPGLSGKILQELDVNGIGWQYYYSTLSTGLASPNDRTQQLRSVKLGQWAQGNAVQNFGSIVFSWYPAMSVTTSGTFASEPLAGKVRSISAYRFSEYSGNLLVQKVDYKYKSGASDHLGSEGDLVQVATSSLVEREVDATGAEVSSGIPKYHTRVAQYRYHTGNSVPPNSDERLTVSGAAHQLKLTISPQQVEYAAEAMGATGIGAIEHAAATLLGYSDDATAFTESSTAIKLIDLAAKVVSYSPYISGSGGKVTAEYIQTSCGCAGASQGVKLAHSFIPWTSGSDYGVTAKIQTYIQSSGSYSTLYRTEYHDMLFMGSDLDSDGKPDVPFLINEAIVEPGSGGRRWVTRYEYDLTTRNIRREIHPSAFTASGSYQSVDDTSGAPVATPSTSDGLVYAYTYSSQNYREDTLVHKGYSTNDSLYTKISSNEYGLTSHPYLVTKFKAWQTDSVPASSSAADIETTTYAYTFYGSTEFPGAVASLAATTESEAVSENGPDGVATYTSWTLFDEAGRSIWSIASDATIIYREYNGPDGAKTKEVANARPGEGDVPALDLSDFGLTGVPDSGNAGDSLTTRYIYNRSGFLTKIIDSSNQETYMIRELRPAIERPNLKYLAITTLPQVASHTGDSGDVDDQATLIVSGTINTRIVDASGSSIQTSSFTVDLGLAYVPPDGSDSTLVQYTQADEVARSTVQQHYSGLTKSHRSWAFLGTSSSSTPFETSFTYDALGRLSSEADPSGSVTEHPTYDVLGRSLEKKVGTSAGTVLAISLYYDDTGSGSPVQGIGDGYLTRVREYTQVSGDPNGIRETRRIYDYRGRLTQLTPPAGPYKTYQYDNIDRVKAVAYFDTPTSNIDSTTGRLLYGQAKYSQRGKRYRDRVATDPTSSSPTFLDTNIWYDSVGRAVAQWEPGSPALKMRYDYLGRPVSIYTTDHGSDGVPGAASTYAYWVGTVSSGVYHLTDDTVIEEAHFDYYSGSSDTNYGKLKLAQRILRNHNGSGTDTLTSSNAIASYIGYTYDELGRGRYTLNYGSNSAIPSGETYSRFENGSATPDPSNLSDPSLSYALKVKQNYDIRGIPWSVRDAKGKITRTLFDHLGRKYAVIENANTVDASDFSWDDTNSKWVLGATLSTSRDTDRVTSYVYNGNGNLTKMTAHATSGSSPVLDEVTEYSYGVTTSTSDPLPSVLNSNRLLREIRFPDRNNGQPGSSDSDKIRLAYNAMGELRESVDQNGTKHTMTRDIYGRVIRDQAVIPSGSPIDTAVQAITADYDAAGRMTATQSRDGSNSVVNEVVFEYTPLWQVSKIRQNASGAASTSSSSTRIVEYSYLTAGVSSGGADNYSRLGGLTYPNGTTQVSFAYGTTGGVNDRINRISSLGLNDSPPKTLLSYDYIGASVVAKVGLDSISVSLDRSLQHNGVRTSGIYPGFDRYGRATRHIWADNAIAQNSTSGKGAFPSIPPIFEEVFSYDSTSNRTMRYDDRPGFTQRKTIDYQFEYDGLNRLIEARRGNQHGGTTTGTGATADWTVKGNGSTRWAIDIVGNWTSVTTDANSNWQLAESSSCDLIESRAYNKVNELLSRSYSTTGSLCAVPAITPSWVYDDAGNMRQGPYSFGNAYKYKHDAWNRLVEVTAGSTILSRSNISPSDKLAGGQAFTGWTALGATAPPSTGSSLYSLLNFQGLGDSPFRSSESELVESASMFSDVTIARYSYNGLHWRTLRDCDTTTPTPNGLDQRHEYVYDASWRVLTEYIDDYTNGGSPNGVNRVAEYFWGLRYVDDLAAKRIDRNADGDFADTNEGLYYAITDAQFSVRAVLDSSGNLLERVSYDPYGVARHSWAGDVNADNAVTTGTTGSTDVTAANAILGKQIYDTGSTGYNADADLNRNGKIDSADVALIGSAKVALSAGLVSDSSGPDIGIGFCGYMFNTETQDYLVRYRVYSARWGRWFERDPGGYVDGVNGYAFNRGNPLIFGDWNGMEPEPKATEIGWFELCLRFIGRETNSEATEAVEKVYEDKCCKDPFNDKYANSLSVKRNERALHTRLNSIGNGLDTCTRLALTALPGSSIVDAAETIGDLCDGKIDLGEAILKGFTSAAPIVKAVKKEVSAGSKVSDTAKKAIKICDEKPKCKLAKDLSIEDISKQLQDIVDEVGTNYDARGIDAMTENQRKAVQKAKSCGDDALATKLEKMFRGYNIDAQVREEIKNNHPLLSERLKGVCNKGPDFIDKETGTWWDMTTPGVWPGKVPKYKNQYGPDGRFLDTTKCQCPKPK